MHTPYLSSAREVTIVTSRDDEALADAWRVKCVVKTGGL